VESYAALTGDRNPVHLDQEYARTSMFGGRIAHGMLAGGLISSALANHLPGRGTVYLSQSMRFHRPVMVDSLIRVVVEVVGIEPKQRVRLSTVVFDAAGIVLVSGEALVTRLAEQ